MKTPVLLSFAFLLFYLPAKTQTSFGIKGSFTNSWMKSDKDAKLGGIATTLTFYKKINKFLELGIEPGMVQRGSMKTPGIEHEYANYIFCCFCTAEGCYGGPGGTAGLKPMNANYIQAPFMARGNFSMAQGRISLLPKIGAGPSWLASGYYETEVYEDDYFNGVPETQALTFESGDVDKRWDWGFYAGAGIGYKLGFGMITFETEMYRGTNSLNQVESSKIRSWSYALGYSIQL